MGGQGGVGLFPNHRLRVIGLGVVYGLGMAVAKHDDPIAFVAGHETAVADLRLAEGVHGSTGRQEVAFVRKAGLGKEGGFGRLLNPVHVEDTGRGIRLLKLGVDPIGEVGAVNLGGGILGRLEVKEASLLIKGRWICPVVAGGEKTGHGREDIVPGVRFLSELAESLQTFASFLREITVVFRGVGDSQSTELLELAGRFCFACGGQTALNRGDTEASQKPGD